MLNHLAIIATTRCDLRCIHCLRGYPEEQRDFPLALLPRLLEEARPFGGRHVALTGGEPGLHPQFERMVEVIVEAGYTWSYASNGQRCEPYGSLMERYRGSFTHAGLSIDGADAATHDAIRGKEGAFEQVTATARRFTSQGFPVQISVTLNRRNQGQVAALVDLATELMAYRISFAGTIPTPWNEELVLSDDESLALYGQLQELRQTAAIEIRHVSSLYTSGGVHFCDILSMRELAFEPGGELRFCCDTVGPGALVGSLPGQPLSNLVEAWLKVAADLQIERARCIAAGQMGEGFDTCAFCDEYFTGGSQQTRNRCQA